MTNVVNKSIYLKFAIIKVVFLKDGLANVSVEKFCVSLCRVSDFIQILHMIMRQSVFLFLYFSGTYILLYFSCMTSFVSLDILVHIYIHSLS